MKFENASGTPSHMKLLGGLFLSAAIFCGSATAGIIVSVTGPEVGNSGLGSGTPNQQIAAVEFTTAGITDGTVLVSLSAVDPLNVTAWLTNAIGPGTTMANVLASNVFSSQVADQQYTALSGINVGAGSYYLVLEAVSQSNDVGWDYTNAAVITGNLDDGDLGALPPPPFAFGPAGSFSGGGNAFLFEVTSSATVPEPGVAGLVGLGLAVMLLLRRARKVDTIFMRARSA